MHREIIDHYSTYFFVEIHLKKRKLEKRFLVYLSPKPPGYISEKEWQKYLAEHF